MPGSAPKAEATTLASVIKKSLKATNKKIKAESIPDTSSSIHTTTTEQGPMSSISTLLSGLDFIFYIWTFLLVALVTYLSLKKYYQMQKDKQQTTSQQQTQQNNSQTATTTPPSGIIPSILHVLFRLTSTVINLLKNYLTSKYVVSNSSSINSPGFWVALLFGVGKQAASYTYLNNCLKWFYFNSETVKRINATIVKKLNAAAVLSDTTFKNSTKRSSLVSVKKKELRIVSSSIFILILFWKLCLISFVYLVFGAKTWRCLFQEHWHITTEILSYSDSWNISRFFGNWKKKSKILYH